MKLLGLIGFVLLSMCSLNSNASDTSGSWTKVVYIYSPVNGAKPFIRFEPGSLPGCYADSGAYMPVNNDVAAARVYSTILSAQVAQKEIKVYYNYNSVADGYSGWGLCDIEAVYIR